MNDEDFAALHVLYMIVGILYDMYVGQNQRWIFIWSKETQK